PAPRPLGATARSRRRRRPILFERVQSQEFSCEVVELLAILALRRTKSVVIDHADLLREPFRPALGAHALLDLVTDRTGQHAARAFTRRAAAGAGDFRHR